MDGIILVWQMKLILQNQKNKAHIRFEVPVTLPHTENIEPSHGRHMPSLDSCDYLNHIEVAAMILVRSA